MTRVKKVLSPTPNSEAFLKRYHKKPSSFLQTDGLRYLICYAKAQGLPTLITPPDTLAPVRGRTSTGAKKFIPEPDKGYLSDFQIKIFLYASLNQIFHQHKIKLHCKKILVCGFCGSC